MLQWEVLLSQVLWLGFLLDGRLNDEPLKLLLLLFVLFLLFTPYVLYTSQSLLPLPLSLSLSLSPCWYSGRCTKPLDSPRTLFPPSILASIFLCQKSLAESQNGCLSQAEVASPIKTMKEHVIFVQRKKENPILSPTAWHGHKLVFLLTRRAHI